MIQSNFDTLMLYAWFYATNNLHYSIFVKNYSFLLNFHNRLLILCGRYLKTNFHYKIKLQLPFSLIYLDKWALEIIDSFGKSSRVNVADK